jgi:membrane associated rhomboid family serine protease
VDAETSSLPTCYRHADRETRLACSSCDRPVCVDCVRTAAVGQKCVECATPERRARVITARELGSERRRSAPVSYTILVVAGLVWLAGYLVPPLGDLFRGYGAQSNLLVAFGQWYRLFTSAFLHDQSGFLHIGFNLWALYVFGPDLERQVGSAPFAAFYFSAAAAGGAAFFFLGSGVAVGASGAIFGLFGAWLVASFRNRHTFAGQASLRQLLVLLGLNMALPLVFPRIAWQAHVGGLVAGIVIAVLWGLAPFARNRATRTLAAVAVGALALATVLLA